MSSPGQSAATAQVRHRKGGEKRSEKAASSVIVGGGIANRRILGLSCCRLVLLALGVGLLVLLLLPAESSTAPEGLASSPPRVDDQAQLEGAAAGSAAGAAAPGGALGLLKPQASWSALVLGGSGATGRVLVAKLANK
jgi:hypothetical protein